MRLSKEGTGLGSRGEKVVQPDLDLRSLGSGFRVCSKGQDPYLLASPSHPPDRVGQEPDGLWDAAFPTSTGVPVQKPHIAALPGDNPWGSCHPSI